MRIAWLLPFLALGCRSPAVGGSHCPTWDRAADFSGRVVHVAWLDDGTSTLPAEAVWAHEEGWLYVFGLAEGDGLRLVLSVSRRADGVELEGGCLEPEETQGPATFRSHMQVDWSTEYVGRVARELVGTEVEPVSWFESAETDLRGRFPERERDADGRLVRFGFSTRYYVPADDATVWIRHELGPAE